MDIIEAKKIYLKVRKKLKAYEYLTWLASWDAETESPEGTVEYRSNQMEIITREIYDIESDSEYVKSIDLLYKNREDLDREFSREILLKHKELMIIKKIPKNEYIQHQVLLGKSFHIWNKAKINNDFTDFKPILKKIVDYQRNFVKYLETKNLSGYDILLDLYEEGYTQKEYDKFFSAVKEKLLPFVKSKINSPNQENIYFNSQSFDISKQKEFSEYLLDVFSYDRKHGLLKTSAHPFTSGVTSVDTRITTRYDKKNLISSIFSTIHELGHAIYEMQNHKKYDQTFLHGGTSLGIHESQSRFYENMIGKSRAFWEVHYKKLKEIFIPQFDNMNLDEFMKIVNKTKASLIRVDADELTYVLHIMIRYDLEKQLINGNLEVEDLPTAWNEKTKEYLGITPMDLKTGVLQDIHWSYGSFGYFPTYALGSAYSAQIYSSMNKEISIIDCIKNNEIFKINEWLKNKIHKYGRTKTPKEIIKLATGEDFDPNYYINYLKKKYE